MRSRFVLGTALTVILLTSAPSLLAQAEQVVFRGSPYTRALSSLEEDLRAGAMDLPELVITRRNDNYFWTSQDNEPLIHIEDGPHHLFIAQSGHYIKILDTEAPGAERLPLPPAPRSRFVYVEHRTNGIHVLTTWGFGTEITPTDMSGRR